MDVDLKLHLDLFRAVCDAYGLDEHYVAGFTLGQDAGDLLTIEVRLIQTKALRDAIARWLLGYDTSAEDETRDTVDAQDRSNRQGSPGHALVDSRKRRRHEHVDIAERPY
jgi:hypothetical protein